MHLCSNNIYKEEDDGDVDLERIKQIIVMTVIQSMSGTPPNDTSFDPSRLFKFIPKYHTTLKLGTHYQVKNPCYKVI